MDDYSEILQLAKETAKQAGDFVCGARTSEMIIEPKSRTDFVSDKDKTAEMLIRESIHKKFPKHLFFGEESVYGTSEEDEIKKIEEFRDEDYIWVVDPIDGTVNYIRDFPVFAISIAVIHHKEIVAGVVYDVYRDELFFAEKGAFKNGVPIHVSDAVLAADSIITTSMPNDLDVRKRITDIISKTAGLFQSMRIWNSAAISLVTTACGRSDADYEAGIHLWDIAAGVLIVKEAGGEITLINGEPYVHTASEVLAANRFNHKEIVSILNSAE